MRAIRFSFNLIIGALLAGSASAQSYSDGFTNGLSSNYWTQTTGGSGYTINSSNGNVQMYNPGGSQGNATVALNLQNALGESSVAGNFTMSIQLSNVNVQGPGVDQAEFHATFGDNSIFYDVRDYEPNGIGQQYHVWNGNINNAVASTDNNFTFTISRVNGVLSGYIDNTLIYSENNSAALTGVSFFTQQYSGSDATGATFDNFSIQAAPEPVTMTLGLGIIGVFIKRKLKK